MKLILYLSIILFAIANANSAQTYYKGKVISENDSLPIESARIVWFGTKSGTLTDKNGEFQIKPVSNSHDLIISYVGYENDTICTEELTTDDFITVTLRLKKSQQEVVVEGEGASTSISAATLLPTEKLSVKEFKRAACCSLAESFETNATVDVSYADAVTGAKHIEMLGLQGSYVQLLTECLPTVRGLGGAFGLDFVPGTWLESISISKGVASVANGYEAMTGQIEIELKKPHESEKMNLNAYYNPIGRYEGNLVNSHSFSDEFGTTLMLHANTLQNRLDPNGDGFLDMPQRTQFNLLNRWRYATETDMIQWGIKALAENRLAGESAFRPSQSIARWNPYGITVNTERYEFFAKSGHVLDEDEINHLSLFLTGQTHAQQSLYGLRNYRGTEKTITARAVLTHKFDDDNALVSGISFLHDQFDEHFDNLSLRRTENVPGVFSELTYKPFEQATVLAGIRYDNHNLFGSFVTPRAMMKYDIAENSTIRLTAGRGYRTANIFAENSSVMVSARTIIIDEPLRAEESWNYGMGYVTTFEMFEKVFTFDADYYRTDFINQIIPDLDRSPREVHFTNTGGTYSNSVQGRLGSTISDNLDITVAYRFNDVRFITNNQLQQRALYSPHKGFVSVSYAPDSWQFDATWTLRSSGRIPFVAEDHAITSDHAHDYATSFDAFSILNMQVQYRFLGFELYVGLENAFDTMQHHPIIDPQNPFGENFDGSLVWGPIMGRMFYSGFRWVME